MRIEQFHVKDGFWMKIVAAQLNPTIGDFQGNSAKILAVLEQAKAAGAAAVLFSELVLCGYPPEDLLLYPSFVEEAERSLEKIVKACGELFVVIGTVRMSRSGSEKPLYNSAAIIQEGRLIGFHDKCLLPTYDVFDEMRYFEPGQEVRIWNFRGQKIAVLICEDIWQHSHPVGYTSYRRDPVEELKKLQPDILLCPSASPYDYQKFEMRLEVCVHAAKSLQCPIVLCNQVGGNDQLIFDGYSFVVDGRGDVQQVGKGFEENFMVIDLRVKKRIFIASDPLSDLYQALVIGVRDYFHKQGFKKACMGLSGGIDSALVACIAVEALGKENVLALSMPSRYSSFQSSTDAQLLAQRLGIEVWQMSIEEPFCSYLHLLKPYFDKRPFDTTEENVQARIRGALLMAISNKFEYLVLSTGNKSELAMGYCTLYGDMCGGLGVISDVTKEQVYALAQWINREGEIIPRSSIEKAPSAELRADQKDSDTLPPYPIVDAVLKAYVEDYLSPQDIARVHDLPLRMVEDLVCRIHRAEYKRRQAPPGLRVSRRAFSAGRRFPIVQKSLSRSHSNQKGG